MNRTLLVDWHVVSAFALATLIVAYVIFVPRARLAWRVNRIFCGLAFGLVVAAAVTGGLLHFAPGWVPRRGLVAVHQAAGWGLVVYVAAHFLAQLALGGLWQLARVVTPRAAYGGAAAVAATAAVLAMSVEPPSRVPIHDMPIALIDTARLTAAELEDATSNTAKPVDILDDGAALPGGPVTVRVRGQRDSDYAYLLFEWQDATDGLFGGERQDVPAVATWKDGWWRLEVKRRLDAHSGP